MPFIIISVIKFRPYTFALKLNSQLAIMIIIVIKDFPPTVAMEQDFVTRTLLQKACHQLQQFSVESSTDTDSGEEGSSDVETMHTRRIKTMEKEILQEPRRTKHDETEPNSFIKDHQQGQEKPKEQRSMGRKADSLPPTGRGEPDPSIPSPALTSSLFPGQQPTIHFPMADELCEYTH